MSGHVSANNGQPSTPTLRQGPGIRSTIARLTESTNKSSRGSITPILAPLPASRKKPWSNTDVPTVKRERHTNHSFRLRRSLRHQHDDRSQPTDSFPCQEMEEGVDHLAFDDLYYDTGQRQRIPTSLSLSIIQEVFNIRPQKASISKGKPCTCRTFKGWQAQQFEGSGRPLAGTCPRGLLMPDKALEVNDEALGKTTSQEGITLPLGNFHVEKTNEYIPVNLRRQPTCISPRRGGEYLDMLSTGDHCIPKNIPAFEYAMRPFLNANRDFSAEKHLGFPSPTQLDTISETVSTRLGFTPSNATAPRRSWSSCSSRDEMKVTPPIRDFAEIDDHMYNVSLPNHVENRDPYGNSLRRMQLSTLLMRCSVLQSLIRGIEPKPWIPGTRKSIHEHYSQMRNLSYSARRFADALGNSELQARCEYWAGRACGGTRDYQAAMNHFSLAIKLDVENDIQADGKLNLRGLRPAEKADVHFLLKCASNRCETWQKRTTMRKQMYRGSGVHFEHFEQEEIQSPLWRPDRDRIIAETREWGKVRTEDQGDYISISQTQFSPRGARDKGQLQWSSEDMAMRHMAKKLLNKKERQYIKHGEGSFDRESPSSNPSIGESQPEHQDMETPPLAPETQFDGKDQRSTLPPSVKASLRADIMQGRTSQELQHDIGRGIKHTVPSTATSHTSKISTASTNLLQRRGKAISPIDTQNTQNGMTLGEAVSCSASHNGHSSRTLILENSIETQIEKLEARERTRGWVAEHAQYGP